MSRQDDDSLDDEESKPSRPGFPVDPYRLLRAVNRGKWWLLIAGVVGALAGVLIGKFVVQHTYESSTSIRYEGLPGQSPMDAQRELPSLVSVTHSDAILLALRDRMGLEASLDLMRRMVQVQSDPGNGLVTFTTTGDTPERSAEAANALVEIFVEHHRARREQELRGEVASLDERIAAAEGELTEARQTYDAFRETNGITDLSTEQEQAIQEAAERRSQADLAQTEIEALEARIAQLEGALARTPRMQAVSGGSSTEQRRLRELRQRLAEARGQGLSDDHPQVSSLSRQVEALERTTSGEGTTRMSVSNLHEQLRSHLTDAQAELEATRQRQASLEALAVQSQARTSAFSAIEGEAASLLAQVNVSEALATELNGEKAHIEDQLRDVQTGFRTVAEARPPESAVPTKRKIGAAVGLPLLFVGIMFSMLMFRELRGLRVHTAAEVAYWGGGPVIGTTTWPRDERALIELIADMDDFAPDAKGSMLVVGASDLERELAEEIASQLNHDWSSTTLIDIPVLGSLPPGTEEDAPPPSSDGYLEDDALDGEIHDGPTELGVPGAGLALYDGPTEISGYEPPRQVPVQGEDPTDRLICTGWNGKSHGQSLRRAARLADRVLVVVTSNAHAATELRKTHTRLGREDGFAYVLIGVSDDVSKLPDRAGSVEPFWAAMS